MSTIVKYNGVSISPAPFVSRSFSPYDIGQRWGYVETIKLDGLATGYQGTGKIGGLTGIFGQSYKTLVIDSAADSQYVSIPNCVLENISFGENRFALETNNAVPYSVTLKAYNTPSGVIDVSDSFAYSDGENGIVSINHTVRAKGIYDGNSPIDNASAFVAARTGRNPVSFAGPIFNQSGNPVLMSVNERIDRSNGSYEVAENWQYETGAYNPYTTVSTLTINSDVKADYPTVSLGIEFIGAITGNISNLRSNASSYVYGNKLTEYGLNASNFYLDTMTSEEKEPNSINVSLNYISGLSAEFTTGAFKTDISMEWDEVTDVKTYSLNSEFIIRGSVTNRFNQINSQKTNILAGHKHYIAYLYFAVSNSAMYAQFGGRPLNPLPKTMSIKNGTTEPSLVFNASFDDADFVTVTTDPLPNGLTYPISMGLVDYKIQFEPEQWIFEVQPASNIEGHFIIQDLNCKTRDKFSVDATVSHIRETLENGIDINSSESLRNIQILHSGIADGLAASKYLTNSNLNSGMHSHSIQRGYIAKTGINPELSSNKFYGFLAGSYNNRNAGYPFGF